MMRDFVVCKKITQRNFILIQILAIPTGMAFFVKPQFTKNSALLNSSFPSSQNERNKGLSIK
jgi:hypothetical protein